MTYTVVLRAEPEGGYTVLVPLLPEIVTFGESVDEARRMAIDAITCAVEHMAESGEATPVEDSSEPLDLDPEAIVPPGLDARPTAIRLLRVDVLTEEAAIA